MGSKKDKDHPVVAGLKSNCNRGLTETDISWSNGNVECTNITSFCLSIGQDGGWSRLCTAPDLYGVLYVRIGFQKH